MDNNYLIFLCLFLASMLIRSVYEQLKEKNKINPENKIIFWFIFLIMCCLWASWFNLCPADPYRIGLPRFVQISGFVICTVGLILAITAFIQLRGLENIDHLVTKGLFAKIRHPMYTGFILWIIGWSIFHGAPVSFLAGLIGIADILYWRRLEEIRLLRNYGEVYRVYRDKSWF